MVATYIAPEVRYDIKSWAVPNWLPRERINKEKSSIWNKLRKLLAASLIFWSNAGEPDASNGPIDTLKSRFLLSSQLFGAMRVKTTAIRFHSPSMLEELTDSTSKVASVYRNGAAWE
jgi:hypothetical protein